MDWKLRPTSPAAWATSWLLECACLQLGARAGQGLRCPAPGLPRSVPKKRSAKAECLCKSISTRACGGPNPAPALPRARGSHCVVHLDCHNVACERSRGSHLTQPVTRSARGLGPRCALLHTGKTAGVRRAAPRGTGPLYQVQGPRRGRGSPPLQRWPAATCMLQRSLRGRRIRGLRGATAAGPVCCLPPDLLGVIGYESTSTLPFLGVILAAPAGASPSCRDTCCP